MRAIFFIGIAGGTGAGKTGFVRRIKQAFSSREILIISQDSYYKDFSHLPVNERGMVNFDHPDSFDRELMVGHVKQLKSGKPVQLPIYDFRSHTRSSETVYVESRSVIIIEGILSYFDPQISEILDLKIFIDVSPDIRVLRRIQRDIRERGRSLESVTKQYLTTVLPMHRQFIEPQKEQAHVIVTYGSKNKAALDLIITKIHSFLDDNL